MFRADKAAAVVESVGAHADAACCCQFTLAVVRQASRFYRQGAVGIGGNDLAFTVIQRRGVDVYRGVGGNHAFAVIDAVLMVQRQTPRAALAYLAFMILQAFCRERELVGGEQAAAVIQRAGCRDAEGVIRDDFRTVCAEVALSGVKGNGVGLRHAA